MGSPQCVRIEYCNNRIITISLSFSFSLPAPFPSSPLPSPVPPCPFPSSPPPSIPPSLVVLRQNQQDRAGRRRPVNNGRSRSVRTTSPQLAPILLNGGQNARLAVLHRSHPLVRPGTPQISRILFHPTVPPQSPQKNSRHPLGRWPRSWGWDKPLSPLTLI